jgi:hypothetical protein
MAQKKQAYYDKFNGGLVTRYSNHDLGPNSENALHEFPIIDNWDYGTRGALEKRAGFTDTIIENQDLLDLGLTQTIIDGNSFDASVYNGPFDMYARFVAKPYKDDGSGNYSNPGENTSALDIRIAIINGYLTILNFNDSVFDGSGNYTIFPTRKILSGLNQGVTMESVQWKDELYIATGDGYYVLRLIEGLGTGLSGEYELQARRMDSADEIYFPDGNEYQIIGKNIFFPDGLSDIDYEFSSPDGLELTGIRVDPSRGVINQESTIQWYYKTPYTDVYQVNHRITITDPDGTQEELVDILAPNGEPFLNHTFKKTGTYTILVQSSTTAESPPAETSYQITYEVLERDDNLNFDTINTQINECTRILLYYNRIILYNNGTGSWYQSDINRPGYFTVYGEFDFTSLNPESNVETLQKVVPYRNNLIVFTKKTIFVVTGAGDVLGGGDDYSPFSGFKVSEKGTIAPNSIANTENYLIFLAKDGIYALGQVFENERQANIYKISDLIDNIVVTDDVNACAVVYDNKYQLNFPSKGYTLKWDYVYGTKVTQASIPDRLWSRDMSPELKFTRMIVIDNELLCLRNEDIERAKLYRKNRIENITDPKAILDLEDNVFPDNFFTDDGTLYASTLETKGYQFDVPFVLKKVKKIILKASFGNFSMIYSANDLKIIDAEELPKITFDDVLGRIVTYTGILETNINLSGTFVLGSSDSGILGFNVLGGDGEQFIYYSLDKARYTQRHKLAIIHSEDDYAKILGLGFEYIVGKNPRDLYNRK